MVNWLTGPSHPPFTTSFEGHVVASSNDERPRIEVDWSDVDGSPMGSTVLLTLQLGGTDHIVGGGAVPPAATEAEMRLVVPGATTLEVKRVLFRTVEVVKIPLTFIAQAPGELTISDLRIATDQVEDRLPAIPETGLCPPTPPGRRRGSGPDDCCFCLCCGAEKQLREPQPTMTRANRPALAGSCPDCGSSIVRGGGRPVRAGLPTRAR